MQINVNTFLIDLIIKFYVEREMCSFFVFFAILQRFVRFYHLNVITHWNR